MTKSYNKTDFSNEELKAALGSHEHEARQILEDKSKVRQLLSNAKLILEKAKGVPGIGSIIDEVLTLFDLIRDYAHGTYRNAPHRVIVSAIAAVIYLVSPIDLIPDFIPFIGLLDDVAVVSLVISLGAGAEIDKYRKWKERLEIDELDTVVSEYEESIRIGEGDLE